MKRITITYHMEKRNETAESCITVPATEETIAGLRALERWEDTRAAEAAHAAVYQLTHWLGVMAGYDTGRYIGFEVSPIQYEEAE